MTTTNTRLRLSMGYDVTVERGDVGVIVRDEDGDVLWTSVQAYGDEQVRDIERVRRRWMATGQDIGRATLQRQLCRLLGAEAVERAS